LFRRASKRRAGSKKQQSQDKIRTCTRIRNPKTGLASKAMSLPREPWLACKQYGLSHDLQMCPGLILAVCTCSRLAARSCTSGRRGCEDLAFPGSILLMSLLLLQSNRPKILFGALGFQVSHCFYALESFYAERLRHLDKSAAPSPKSESVSARKNGHPDLLCVEAQTSHVVELNV
jgi:hypothetical protein